MEEVIGSISIRSTKFHLAILAGDFGLRFYRASTLKRSKPLGSSHDRPLSQSYDLASQREMTI
jgi:hypothetical protein